MLNIRPDIGVIFQKCEISGSDIDVIFQTYEISGLDIHRRDISEM